ncbi:hypothetical protein [Flavivirga eckloniae]|uniref:Uncharacterized protein n=1 Tax=Flavivirga eckloniae TaxID=1803846 RepID=A0A2K9PTE6_9FLAO|nr:hypothetical protein [Flavivirga eckloniae]AUP80332.1 hypothetical protein C1H87_17100 [Flavivirga eckloniae]
MKTRFFSAIVTCFIVTTVFSQSSLNNYKYVIVPKKYDFLKQEDQYQLNSLTQFLFKKHGFIALMEGDTYPEDLIRNRCLALKSDVSKASTMFKTKLAVALKNCNDQVVYTSKEGESREKDYGKSYVGALRAAFKDIEALNYKYEPNENITGLETQSTAVVKNDEVTQEIKQLKQEIQNLKKEKEAVVDTQTEVKPVPKVETVAAIASTHVESPVKIEAKGVLYAQEIENGFQLVDSSPKVVYRIKRTKLDNIFLVENTSAIIYKKGDGWVIEYYSNNVLKQEALHIKF